MTENREGDSGRKQRRWYNPVRWAVGTGEAVGSYGKKVATEAYLGLTAYPSAAYRGIREANAMFAAASEWEKRVINVSLFWWGALGAISVFLNFAMPSVFTNALVVLVSGAFLLRNRAQGRFNIVRTVVLNWYGRTGVGDASRRDAVMLSEVARIRIEEIERQIKQWKTYPKAEQIATASTVFLEIMAVGRREMNYPGADAGADVEPEDSPQEPVSEGGKREAEGEGNPLPEGAVARPE